MNITKRERILLTVLAVLLIVVGGWLLLIKPSLDSLTVSIQRSLDVRAQKQTFELNSAQAKNLAAAIDKQKTDAISAAAAFFPSLRDDRLQTFVEGISVAAGVPHYTLTISQTQLKAPGGGASVPSALDYPLGQIAQALNPAAQKKATAAVSADTVEYANVTVQFDADYAALTKFLDGVKNSGRTARVTSLQISKQAGALLAVTVGIDCYGIRKLDDSDALTDPVPAQPSGRTSLFP